MRQEIKRRWQETFNVDGHKITVVIKLRTRVGNPTGFKAEVYDNHGNAMTIPAINKIDPAEAQEYAYVKFVKEYC